MFGLGYLYFASQLNENMTGRKWDLPSRLYPTVLTLAVQQRIPPGPLARSLEAMGYIQAKPVQNPGEYREAGPGHYYVRPRAAWHGLEGVLNETLEVQVKNGLVVGLQVFKGRALTRAIIPPVSFAEIRSPDQEIRRLVRYRDLPKHLVDAVIAIEDQRFYRHFGIDPRGLARALYINVTRGNRSQGGSTLTQQLAKNYFLTHEKTLDRKVKEIFYALALERKYSKDEILELYLNEIYLGQRGSVALSGMGQAAYAFFSKDVRQLTLEESALLAGIIQAPNFYAPDRHLERAKARRDVVLKKMLEQGSITEAAFKAAQKQPVRLRPGPYVGRTAPFFVDFVHEQLGSKFPDATFNTEGFTLETTLDLRMQQIAERVLAERLSKIDGSSRAPLEGALVVLEPATGRILAMVGGRNYSSSQFNRVSQAHRQPGSVFKPLVILAALQARGTALGPTTILKDEPLTLQIDGKEWSPQNNDLQYHGDVSLRQVIEQSLNVPTVRLAHDVGIERVVKLLRTLDITSPLKPAPSLALGAFEVTPLEVAAAFTVLATPGVLHAPYAIQRMRDREGLVLLEHKAESRQVASAAEAFMIRDMMRGVLDRGTGKSARTMGYSFKAAGKTGTTNDNKDAWFVGFDADLLCVVWVGSDQAASTGLTGGKAALPIWVEVMQQIRQSVPAPPDPIPSGLSVAQRCVESGQRPRERCPLTEQELFWAGQEPTEDCSVHVEVLEELGEKIGEKVQRIPGFFQRLFGRNHD